MAHWQITRLSRYSLDALFSFYYIVIFMFLLAFALSPPLLCGQDLSHFCCKHEGLCMMVRPENFCELCYSSRLAHFLVHHDRHCLGSIWQTNETDHQEHSRRRFQKRNLKSTNPNTSSSMQIQSLFRMIINGSEGAHIMSLLMTEPNGARL